MKKNYNIMIVDNKDDNLQVLKEALASEDYTIEVFNNPIKALENFKDKKYHIILTEADMIEIDCIEFLKRLKDYDSLVQIIIMSENSTMDKFIQCLEFGANDYIVAPLSNVEYIKEVTNYSIEKLERWRNSIREILN